MEQNELGRRLRMYLFFVAGMLALVTGLIVIPRLSTDAVAMLIGLTLGAALMSPLTVLGWWLLRRTEARNRGRQAPTGAMAPMGVVPLMVMPSAPYYTDHALVPRWGSSGRSSVAAIWAPPTQEQRRSPAQMWEQPNGWSSQGRRFIVMGDET